ncbi:unnamed protein product, partial [marine sediment metagenome]
RPEFALHSLVKKYVLIVEIIKKILYAKLMIKPNYYTHIQKYTLKCINVVNAGLNGDRDYFAINIGH